MNSMQGETTSDEYYRRQERILNYLAGFADEYIKKVKSTSIPEFARIAREGMLSELNRYKDPSKYDTEIVDIANWIYKEIYQKYLDYPEPQVPSPDVSRKLNNLVQEKRQQLQNPDQRTLKANIRKFNQQFESQWQALGTKPDPNKEQLLLNHIYRLEQLKKIYPNAQQDELKANIKLCVDKLVEERSKKIQSTTRTVTKRKQGFFASAFKSLAKISKRAKNVYSKQELDSHPQVADNNDYIKKIVFERKEIEQYKIEPKAETQFAKDIERHFVLLVFPEHPYNTITIEIPYPDGKPVLFNLNDKKEIVWDQVDNWANKTVDEKRIYFNSAAAFIGHRMHGANRDYDCEKVMTVVQGHSADVFKIFAKDFKLEGQEFQIGPNSGITVSLSSTADSTQLQFKLPIYSVGISEEKNFGKMAYQNTKGEVKYIDTAVEYNLFQAINKQTLEAIQKKDYDPNKPLKIEYRDSKNKQRTETILPLAVISAKIAYTPSTKPTKENPSGIQGNQYEIEVTSYSKRLKKEQQPSAILSTKAQKI